jgi:alanine transaminase
VLPIPQYPIYSATVDLLNGRKVPYYLDENKDWALNLAELEHSYDTAVASGIDVVALVLINPGNPTGQVLTKQNVRDIVEFCVRKHIVLMADEVYQENVYCNGYNSIVVDQNGGSDNAGNGDVVETTTDEDVSFYSCKKAAADLELLDSLELFSFHSISKGVFGECGQRGGYMELSGIDEAVHAELYKLASSGLCSSVTGQILTALMCRGPAKGDVSYESHELEKLQLWQSLKRKSRIVSDGLNAIKGFSCRPAKGSMYCFPAVQMPSHAIDRADQLGMSVDTFYCLDLLKATGICVVPASGFGQREGRHGFRTTFLPDESVLRDVVDKIRAHYTDFLAGDYRYTN